MNRKINTKLLTGRNNAVSEKKLFNDIIRILKTARSKGYKAVNIVMVEAYWYAGQRIVEEEQKGKKYAGYGERLIENLSVKIKDEFGEGFSSQSLWNMRQFYFRFPILSTLWRELTWSHYKLLIRVDDERARKFYAKEAVDGNWSVRALERQIHTFYYQRLISSRNKKGVKKEAAIKSISEKVVPENFIKNPYVLEFLNIKHGTEYLEKDLEKALLSQLQRFLLELGRGFSFVARQQRIQTETKDFFVDLVFYNYILKCFVLIDIKTTELTHQDIGQMDMYVRMYEEKKKNIGDNPTIGIILCAEKDETVVKYSVMKDNKKLFASKYKLYLPTEEELKKEIEKEKEDFMLKEEPVKYGNHRKKVNKREKVGRT
jgi:predicted nuclease of restriction endonuclease-like (RecB) superfamily